MQREPIHPFNQFLSMARLAKLQNMTRQSISNSTRMFLLPFDLLPSHILFLLNLWQPLTSFSISVILSFQECYPNGIRQYTTYWTSLFCFVLFCFHSTSYSEDSSRLLHILSFFLFIAEEHSMIQRYRCTTMYLPTCLLKDSWVVSSQGPLLVKLL